MLEKVTAWFSRKPQTGKRFFDLAGTTTRLTSDWSTVKKAIDQDILAKGSNLRTRARNLVTDTALAAQYVRLIQTNVIGCEGFKLRVNAVGSDGKTPNTVANEAIEKAWDDFCKAPTLSGDTTLNDFLDIQLNSALVDGESITRKHIGATNKYGFAISPLDADLLNEKIIREPADGKNEIRLGIELDADGKPVAYYFRKQQGLTPYGMGLQYENSAVRVDAGEVIHSFIGSFVGQSRGYTSFAPVLYELQLLKQYEEAELLAARLGAAFGGFFTSETGDPIPGAENQSGEMILPMEPGVFRQLPQGVDFKAFLPSHPTTQYGDFVKAVKMNIAAGLGVSYNSLCVDLESTSYSSARVGLLQERETYKQYQRLVINQILLPIYKEWLKSAISVGAIALPKSVLQKLSQFTDNATFTGRSWPWVDPQKDLTSQVDALKAGLTSRSELAAQQGKDWKEIADQLALEQAYFKSKDIQTELITTKVNDGNPDTGNQPGTTKPTGQTV